MGGSTEALVGGLGFHGFDREGVDHSTDDSKVSDSRSDDRVLL